MESTQPIPRPPVTEPERRQGPKLLKATINDFETIDDFLTEDGRTAPWESTPVQVRSETHEAGSRGTPRWVVVVLAAAAIVQAPFVASSVLGWLGLTGQRGAQLVIETSPAALEVLVDGVPAGKSPVVMSVAPGQRSVELRYQGRARVFPVGVGAGDVVRQRFEFAEPERSALGAGVGGLVVSTEPAGLAVLLDGQPRGVTPLVAADLTPGEHVVIARFARGAVERRVTVEAGSTSTIHILAPATPPTQASATGWLSVVAPIAVQITEAGRVLGRSDDGNLALSAGEHVLDFGSDERGFQSQQRVLIAAQTTSTIRLQVPSGSISINASPWAEVYVDGERIGETPIGNLSRPAGRHEVVFRHPELGERRETVILRPDQPTRLSVNLRDRQ